MDSLYCSADKFMVLKMNTREVRQNRCVSLKNLIFYTTEELGFWVEKQINWKNPEFIFDFLFQFCQMQKQLPTAAEKKTFVAHKLKYDPPLLLSLKEAITFQWKHLFHWEKENVLYQKEKQNGN